MNTMKTSANDERISSPLPACRCSHCGFYRTAVAIIAFAGDFSVGPASGAACVFTWKAGAPGRGCGCSRVIMTIATKVNITIRKSIFNARMRFARRWAFKSYLFKLI